MVEPIPLRPSDAPGQAPPSLDELLESTARGDEQAFGRLYDQLSSAVHGLGRRVIRDPARAEEITQEVFLQLWQTAHRFDSSRGSARTWVMTLTHRRAVDVVRRDQSSSDREDRYDWTGGPDVDVVAEAVTARFEHEQVRRCIGSLTDLQREAVTLAYYGGYTYAEVASLLDANLATIKTRMRDGLIRLRDCMGVTR
ncbi:MAG: ECF RNA polymerase sigma factor SigK [Actinomycetota bacterium]|nr:ECF RNA polymerase sigma factor SigK [Actinomycetota bacterium]